MKTQTMFLEKRPETGFREEDKGVGLICPLNAGGLTGEVSDVFKLIFDGEITVDDIYGLEGVEKIEDGLLEGVQFL